MTASGDQRDETVDASAGDPGPLSRLLQELAEASGDDALEAWTNELAPGDRVGRFEIRQEVGRGGFGAVYEALDTELNRVVAVKTLRFSRERRDLSSEWLKREAEAVARLDHPCIVTLFDVGTSDAGPYLVMELLRGRTLAQRIGEGPVPQVEALRIAGETAKGLAHAHQRGVLHRDLKPHFGEAEPGAYRPTTFMDPANTFHEKAIACRAAENTCFVASVNCGGEGSPTTSAVASPDGTVLAWQPYGKAGLLVVDLDLDEAGQDSSPADAECRDAMARSGRFDAGNGPRRGRRADGAFMLS